MADIIGNRNISKRMITVYLCTVRFYQEFAVAQNEIIFVLFEINFSS